VFLSGYGYSADPTLTGDRPLNESWPSLLDLCGFDPGQPARPRTPNRGRRLLKRTPERLPRPLESLESSWIFRCLDATLRPETEVLFEIEEEKTPYLTRARVGDAGGQVYTFCGGLWPRTLPAIPPLVRHILERLGDRGGDLDAGPGILYNFTRKGFLIATNPTADPSWIDCSEGAARYWNVRTRAFEPTTRIEIPPYDFFLGRRLMDGERVLDVEGAALLRLEDPPGGSSSRLLLDARGPVTLRLLEEPREVWIHGNRVIAQRTPEPESADLSSGAVSYSFPLEPGEALIELDWSV
jgi:hypothetical protein